MNKLQLQYIKEEQQQNVITLPSIQMRATIDNSIIEELDTIYNPNLLGTETEFKSSLADVSLSHDFLDDTHMIKVIRDYGTDAVLIYMFIHTKMCHEGYKIEWNEMQEDVYSATLMGIYKVAIENFKNIINALLQNCLLYIVKDETGKKWLTSSYQIYMYERVSAKRVRDRVYKKNQPLSADEKIEINCKLPAFEDIKPIKDGKKIDGLNQDTIFNVPESLISDLPFNIPESHNSDVTLDDDNILF